MLQNRLAGALGALLLCLVPLSAQSSDSDSSTPDCFRGRARGAWDLPVRDQAGQVKGLLADIAGHRLALEARLTPALRERGGRIDGILTPITSAGIAAQPLAEIHGIYAVGPDGRGRFQAEIVGIPNKDGRPQVVGKMEGAFADPLRDGVDTVGRFAGRWILCR